MISSLFKRRIFRYLLSGGTAAGVNILSFFVFTHYFNIWYIHSSLISYSMAFGVSFMLQKLWTFKIVSLGRIKKELILYLIVFVVGNILNTIMLFSLVEYMHLHYLIAQIISNGIIAIGNFFAYKYFIFLK